MKVCLIKDYDRANPVTQEAANIEWIKLFEGKTQKDLEYYLVYG